MDKWHHVRHDDYPRLVDGNLFQPPLNAEILSAVTAYVWTRRTYGSVAAHKAIEEGTGTMFHPKVAEALLGVITSTRAEEPLRRAVV